MKVLVIRLSALGDVAMTLPLLYSVAKHNRQSEFYLLSLPFHKNLLIDPPANLHFLAVDTHGRHKGLRGLFSLFKELRAQRFTHLIDLHRVLRSLCLTTLFRLCGSTRVSVIDKGRNEKRMLTARNHKRFVPLQTTYERYQATFDRAGFRSGAPFVPFFQEEKREHEDCCIGIAPFAKYAGKCYPLQRMQQVVAELSSLGKFRIYLFGGGKEEQERLEEWEARYPNVRSTVGKQSLRDELRLMARMKIMITMDSANMHLASLTGTRVISVWGSTHPYAGFYGWGQRPEDAVQADLPCRPCSVFGNRPCWKGTLECMNSISPQTIIQKVLDYAE